MGSIIGGNRDVFSSVIDNSEYYDYRLEGGYDTELFALYEDSSNTFINKNGLYITNNISKLPKDKDIEDYGYHAVDSGKLKLRLDTMSNKSFYDTIVNHKGVLHSDRVELTKVGSNTDKYNDLNNPIELGEDGMLFNGSYYQGIFGDREDILLKYLTNNEDFSIRLRMKPDFNSYNKSSVNKDYPSNEGTFFYIGVKSESKMLNGINIKDKLPNEDPLNCDVTYFNDDYITYKDDKNLSYTSGGADFGNVYIGDNEYSSEYFMNMGDVGSYFSDDYMTNSNPNRGVREYTLSDYFAKEEDLSGKFDIAEEDFCDKDIKRVKTDNKFLLFSRKCRDYTTSKWIADKAENIDHYIEYENSNSDNKFLTFNRSCNGFTVDTYRKYYNCKLREYSLLNDLKENAFSLLSNRDGSISFRYLISSCENKERYEVVSGTTRAGLLKSDISTDVRVMFKHNIIGYDSCGKAITNGFKIWVYVDGLLKYISKTLPEFRFRGLDMKHKYQSGLGYNISLGGGTLGLSNKVNLEDTKLLNYERSYVDTHFNGVYMGSISNFQIYPEPRHEGVSLVKAHDTYNKLITVYR